MPKGFFIVVAMDQQQGIGQNNQLPWHLPEDLKHFREITTAQSTSNLPNAVVMGRKTWESLPPERRPLKGRVNMVITRQGNFPLPEGVQAAHSLDEAITTMLGQPITQIFVIGGASIYEHAIHHPLCEGIYLTRIETVFVCDTFFPKIPTRFKRMDQSEVKQQGDICYRFERYIS